MGFGGFPLPLPGLVAVGVGGWVVVVVVVVVLGVLVAVGARSTPRPTLLSDAEVAPIVGIELARTVGMEERSLVGEPPLTTAALVHGV